MQPTTLMGSAAVCRRLDIDRSTLSRWVSARRIEPAFRLEGPRGAFLFSEEEVERLEQTLTQDKASA